MRTFLIIAAMGAASARAQYVAQFLETPTGRGDARGAGGGQIVGDVVPGIGGQPCYWDGAQFDFHNLPTVGYDYGVANGVGGGKQVGFGFTEGDTRAVMWSGSAGKIVDLHTSQYSGTIAYATDGASQVGAGSPFQFGVSHALLWRGTAKSAVSLHPVGYDMSEARAVFGDVQVGDVSGGKDGQAGGAAIWRGTAESMQLLPAPKGLSASAFGIHGSQVVGRISGLGATIWDIDQWKYTVLGEGFAVDANGLHQVGYAGGTFEEHALRWSGTEKSRLDLHQFLPIGFSRSIATGIDDNGNIVGFGLLSGIGTVPIVWTPVPEPSTVAAIGFGILTLLLRRRVNG